MSTPNTGAMASASDAVVIDHEFKSHPSVFWPAAYGQKMFEYRRDDRGGYEIGQTVRLRLWHGDTGYADVPPLDRRITNILRGGEFELPQSHCILGLAPVDAALASPPLAVMPEEVRRLSEAADLRELSSKAAAGPWHVDMFPFRDCETGEEQPPQCEGICTHDEAGGLAESIATCSEPEARFIVALVNAYRGLATPSGQADTPPGGGGAVEGWKLVPADPSEEMWSGLARQIVMWHRAHRPTDANLFRDLKNCGWPIPAWLKDEIEDADYVPPKGAVAVAIYRAMLDDAPAAPEPEAGGEREIVRHIKSGGVYEVVGEAGLQVSVGTGCSPTGNCIHEDDRLVVYRGADGRLWAREENEFRDGRFETITEARTLLSAEAQTAAGGGGWRFDMESAPRDGSTVLVAVEGRDSKPPIVGEAYIDADNGGAWWWVNEGYGDYHASPIHETLSQPYAWKPLDKAPPKPTPTDTGTEGGQR